MWFNHIQWSCCSRPRLIAAFELITISILLCKIVIYQAMCVHIVALFMVPHVLGGVPTFGRTYYPYFSPRGSVHRNSMWINIQHMQQYAAIYLLQKATLHVSGVTAPIIRSIKNCTRSLRHSSYYLYRYSSPTWSDRDWFVRVDSTHTNQSRSDHVGRV